MCNSWGCTNKKSLLCHDTALTTQFLTALIDTVQAFDKIEPSYLCLIYGTPLFDLSPEAVQFVSDTTFP